MGKREKASYFGFLPKSTEVVGGGEVKTKTVLKALKKSGVFEKVFTIDTSNWRKKKISLMIKLLKAMVKTRYIIVVQSTSAFLKILPLLNILAKVLKNEIHFIPVGNCLATNFNRKSQIRDINRIKGVYVQSENIKDNLVKIGIDNIIVMHNFKYMKAYLTSYEFETPLNYVFLSRVSEEKGVFDCINVFDRINESFGKIVCKLDIYGKIDEDIKEKFLLNIQDKSYINYCGVVKPEEASRIIQKYYMLVFPTKYIGEGFPGAIIDAFGAGVPILSSRFSNYSDMLTDGFDSVSFAFNDYENMYEKLLYCQENFIKINEMRNNSHTNYLKYQPEEEIKKILDNLGRI